MEQFFDFDPQSVIDRLLYIEMRHDFENRDFIVSDIVQIIDEKLLVFGLNGAIPSLQDEPATSIIRWKNGDNGTLMPFVARKAPADDYWCVVARLPKQCQTIRLEVTPETREYIMSPLVLCCLDENCFGKNHIFFIQKLDPKTKFISASIHSRTDLEVRDSEVVEFSQLRVVAYEEQDPLCN